MSVSRLNRMRRMTFDELRWRAIELTRTFSDRIHSRLRTPAWDLNDITRVLSPRAADAALRDAVGRRDWSAVDDGLVRRLSMRQSRCVINPASAARLRVEVLRRWPDAAADAVQRAERILDGSYDLLGYRGLRFSDSSANPEAHQPDIDWHYDPVHRRRAPRVCWAEVPYLNPAIGDHKLIWELNRHQHWLQLGRAWWLTRDVRYARAIVGQMGTWLDANPPLTGINWSSMLEVGFRTISWTMAIHLLLEDGGWQRTDNGEEPPWLVAALVALDRQLTHVEHHLSHYFSPNTHLTGEALALYVVGQAFPELTRSERWVSTGRTVLFREIDRQILADGGHVERSTHYQRYTLDFYLLALLTARRAGDVDAERTFASAATRLAEYTRAMADDEGRLALIGDDDGGMLWPIAGRACDDVRDSLAVAAVALDRPDFAPWGIPEEAFWIAGSEAIEARITRTSPGLPSQTLAITGYVVMRDSNGGHAVFDAGAHGYLNCGHAHADALSLTLSIGSQPLLIDPGTSTYTMNPGLRDRMRSTFSHNTVTVDGLPQSTPAGPFHWRTRTDGRLQSSVHNPRFDWVEAVHDGYAPHLHRRSVIRVSEAGWLIVDQVEGNGTHSTDTHWHFHPGWMVRADGNGRIRATHLDGEVAWLLCDAGEISAFYGDDGTGLGWYAPTYGTLLSTWTARIRQVGRLPLSTITWIGAGTAMVPPVLERLTLNAAAAQAVAARVAVGEIASVFLVRPGDGQPGDSRAHGIGRYQTNARFLHVRTRGDVLLALDMADASHALALRDGWVSIAASEPIRDLHLKLDGSVLELAASEPPRQLDLQGTGVAGLSEIRLNGRSRPPTPTNRPDTLLISGGEWAYPALVHSGARFALDEVRPEGCEAISPLRES